MLQDFPGGADDTPARFDHQAFKPGTDDLRDAPSLGIASRLLNRGAVVSAYDPVVKELPEDSSIRMGTDPYDAAERADAVVLLTESTEFQDVDYDQLPKVMAESLALDRRSALDPGRGAGCRSARDRHMVVTMARTALITGGAAFLGSHLCDRLLSDGWHVICVDNFVTGSRGNIAHLEAHDNFRLWEADVTDPLTIDLRLDAILHFASPASPIDYLRLPIETMKVGSVGTFNALELARTRGARFLLASTSETYGDPQVHPQPESYGGHVNPVGPRAVYDEARRFAEALMTAYRSHHGVNAAIVRIFNTYRPRMRPDDGRAIPTFISQALRSAPMTVAGDGQQTSSVCYVDDLIDGIVRLLESLEDGPINIDNPSELSMLDLAGMVRDLTLSDSAIAFVPRPQDDPSVGRPDITLARDLLGWSPRVGPLEGLNRTIEWVRLHATAEDFPYALASRT